MVSPLAFFLAPALLLQSAAPAVLNPGYAALLRRYARGERKAAVAALGEWRAADLDRQVRALERAARDGPPCPGCADPLDGVPLKAAVMLHFDRGESERPRGTGVEAPRPCPGAQTSRAGQVAAILARRRGTEEFARRFFLAVSQVCQWDFCLEPAARWARDGLERFPADASLLLTLGSILEEGATISRLPPAQRVPQFRDAERVLAQAVAADPAALEPRVRLGRVQWRLRKDEEAARMLEGARSLGGPADQEYLAHLYLGIVYQRLGRGPAAIGELREALAIQPDAQAAAVALSYALGSAGDAGGARDVLGPALAWAGLRERRDPYWQYPASNASSVDAILAALRDESAE